MNELLLIYVGLMIIKAILLISDVWVLISMTNGLREYNLSGISFLIAFIIVYVLVTLTLPISVVFYLLQEKWTFFRVRTKKEVDLIINSNIVDV
jgi:membrane protein implicated in regulation of membrane protease activity